MARKPRPPHATTPVAPVGRRRLATGATLLAAFGSIGPFAGSAEAAAEIDASKLATVEDYARQDFEPWPPGTIDKIGDRGKWFMRTSEDYIGIAMAAAAMERTPEQLAAFKDEETANIAIATAASLHDMAERYEGLAAMLSGASVRMLAGVARYCLATEEEV